MNMSQGRVIEAIEEHGWHPVHAAYADISFRRRTHRFIEVTMLAHGGMGHDNGEICGVLPCVPFLIVFSNSCADLSQHGCMGGLNIKLTPIITWV